MSTPFRIDYDWLPNEYEDTTEGEGSTLAELVINVGPWCATEVDDIFAKTVRSSARLSTLRLAEWFAANWWRLIWEPESDNYSWRASHKMGNVGYGYVWPDLSFSSDWQSVHIRSRPTARREAEPIRYLNRFDHQVSISEFERGVDDFINGIIARLSSIKNTQSDLSMLWDEVLSERHDPESSELRILEACMGYDPDEAPPALLGDLRLYMSDYGANAIQEMAAACKDKTVSRMNDLWENAQESDVIAHVPNCDDIRQRFTTEAIHSDIPWKRAEQVARIAREVWRLDTPISTSRLCDLFSIPDVDLWDYRPSGWGPLIAGFRDTAISDSFHISLNSKYGTSRRFGLARLVADHIVTGKEETLLPGTRSITSRQKFQRAFAQEFLCPFEALKEHLNSEAPDSDDIHDAAQYFDVSPLMIQTTLVNKGVLGRDTLETGVE